MVLQSALASFKLLYQLHSLQVSHSLMSMLCCTQLTVPGNHLQTWLPLPPKLHRTVVTTLSFLGIFIILFIYYFNMFSKHTCKLFIYSITYVLGHWNLQTSYIVPPWHRSRWILVTFLLWIEMTNNQVKIYIILAPGIDILSLLKSEGQKYASGSLKELFVLHILPFLCKINTKILQSTYKGVAVHSSPTYSLMWLCNQATEIHNKNSITFF